MANAAGAHDLSKPSAEAPEPEGVEVPKALYAFAVIATDDGEVGVYDYEAEGIDPVLKANNDIIYGACATVMKDITAQTTAQASIQMQMVQAQAMHQQMEQQRLAASLDLAGHRG